MLNLNMISCSLGSKQGGDLEFGGTGAVSIMKKACEAKEAKVAATEIVAWAEKKREKTITNCF